MMNYLLVLLMAHAAPHKSAAPDYPDFVHIDTIRYMLQTPDRAADIKKMGPQGYKQLRAILFSPTEPVDKRWNAALVMAKIGGVDSLPDIERASKDKVWYMRSASLLALGIVSKDKAMQKARYLMQKDQALLVRASALQVLAQNPVVDRDFLWTQMYNPMNFNNGQSLSIRHSILKVLSENQKKTETAKFVALMRENDPQIQNAAQRSLEVLYKKKAPIGLTRDKQLAFWKD